MSFKFNPTTGNLDLVGAAGGGSGTVTSVASGTGLSGGPITTTGTLSLANTAVTPGAYTSADITIDAQGRITAAANGSGGGGATIALDNLADTAINTDLTFGAAVNGYLGTAPNTSGGSSAILTISSGPVSGTDSGQHSGALNISTGANGATSATGPSGDITIATGAITDVDASENSGNIAIRTGNNDGTLDTGNIDLIIGTAATGAQGSISLSSTAGFVFINALAVVIPHSTSNPSTTSTGACYYNTSDDTLRVYNGGWKSIVLV